MLAQACRRISIQPSYTLFSKLETPDVIACDKREAFAQGSASDETIHPSPCSGVDCFASLAMTAREGGGSVRLLSQRRMRPAEVRCCRILPDLDDAAADGAGAGEVLEQRFAVVAADRAGEL